MTETAVHPEPDQTEAEGHVVPEAPFDDSDIAAFREEDREAVTNIGKLLVAFFFYSLVVMIIVAMVCLMSDWV